MTGVRDGTLTVAELCAGYGGLYMAMRAAGWPARLSWYAEIDPDASRVMAAHHPDAPNIGDITTTQFTACERVDVIAAGYPCQPFSVAGLRRGVEDERWIWPDIARAVRLVRPRWVLLENVPGHLEQGFSRVVGDLAALGYVGSWVCVRASDVGAAHRRERIFIVAANSQYAERAGVRKSAKVAQGHDSGAESEVALLPTPLANDTTSHRNGRGRLTLTGAVQPERWGRYSAAISRWERVTGRPAPDPTEPNQSGQLRLSTRFVEWLMGLPPGHVTDHVGRAAALRILGNGVVPQQGAHALGLLVAGGAA